MGVAVTTTSTISCTLHLFDDLYLSGNFNFSDNFYNDSSFNHFRLPTPAGTRREEHHQQQNDEKR